MRVHHAASPTRPIANAPKPRRHRTIAATGFVLLLAMLAGCSSSSDANESPTAKLSVSPSTGWSTQAFTFDGRESSDDDGDVVLWHFDYGDQSNADARSQEAARQTHTYAHGGAYTATLTVTDNSHDGDGAETDTDSKRVVVNERQTVVAQGVYASPANLTVSSERTVDFQVYASADKATFTYNATSLNAIGQSQVRIRLLAPNGDVLAEKTVDVTGGQRVTQSLDGALGVAGKYQVQIHANSGAVQVDGNIARYYK